jgi:hypothetical protein
MWNRDDDQGTTGPTYLIQGNSIGSTWLHLPEAKGDHGDQLLMQTIQPWFPFDRQGIERQQNTSIGTVETKTIAAIAHLTSCLIATQPNICDSQMNGWTHEQVDFKTHQ